MLANVSIARVCIIVSLISEPFDHFFQLLPDNIGDPTELLSYLGPINNMCNSENNNSNNNDDLFSLFS